MVLELANKKAVQINELGRSWLAQALKGWEIGMAVASFCPSSHGIYVDVQMFKMGGQLKQVEQLRTVLSAETSMNHRIVQVL
ncbi:hypothetical protein D5086_002956 [Populus alba]|uniref:Uncharacterized protein n=1 Tax=Populus alba TaxID=43335 RepID=A0ACC4D335_POPAL